ncbi:outer membrane protein transport protein [Flavobacteriaceae bacterium]|nr:outer membrane protein transport protein [Flavobacteriaceae bacterium]MDC3238264.1 outer membrane protein transport protein [Flavobacteriaceae bacterium]
MKKFIPHVLMIFLYTSASYAQSIDDILRYSRTELKGSARYVSLGGAFNALGGDFSAINDNPAAAAVFLNSEIGVTLNNLDNKVNANYMGNNNNVDSRSMDFDQFGMVFVLNDTSTGDFPKLTFAFNFQNTQIFNDKFNAIGTNSNKSLDDYFLFFADGVPFSQIKTYDNEPLPQSYKYLGENFGYGSQQAFLGYQGYLISPEEYEDSNSLYYSNSKPQGQAVDHDFFVTHSGKNSKNSISMATQYRQSLYLGFNVNFHNSRFKRIDNLLEYNYGSGSNFRSTEFENELLTTGEGFSFQLGAIYKPNNNIRLGLSYQSPVWYEMIDELRQFISSAKNSGLDTIDPQVTNIYEYKLSIPSRLSGGLAYVFGTKGLISFQYDRVNYQNTSFDIGNGDDNFIYQNKRIETTLKSAGTLRVGGEYRIDRLSLRAGYFNQENINKTALDLSKGTTFGLGYDFGASILNFSLSNIEYQHSELMYQEGLNDSIQLNKDQIQFLVSYSFKL